VAGADLTADDEVGPGITPGAGVAVDEGERLGGGAGAGERGDEPLERLELPAPVERPLEVAGVAAAGHLLDHATDRLDRAPLAERRRALGALTVGPLGDRAGTRPAAGPEVVARAGGPSRLAEQLGLLRIVHRHVGATIAHAEEVDQDPGAVADPRRRAEWTVDPAAIALRGGGHHQAWRRLVGDDKEGMLPGPVHLDVERRAMLADQRQLGERRRELARRRVELDVGRGVKDPGRLVLGVAGPEVGEQPGPERLRLADVEDPAGRVEHSIGAGAVVGAPPVTVAERLEGGDAKGEGEGAHDRKDRTEKREARSEKVVTPSAARGRSLPSRSAPSPPARGDSQPGSSRFSLLASRLSLLCLAPP